MKVLKHLNTVNFWTVSGIAKANSIDLQKHQEGYNTALTLVTSLILKAVFFMKSPEQKYS